MGRLPSSFWPFSSFSEDVTNSNNLSESRFRKYWEQTDRDDREIDRFREVARLIETDAGQPKDAGSLLATIREHAEPLMDCDILTERHFRDGPGSTRVSGFCRRRLNIGWQCHLAKLTGPNAHWHPKTIPRLTVF